MCFLIYEAREVLILEEKKQREELRLSRCLAGKVLSLKLVNRDAFKNTILQAWRTLRISVVIKSIGENMFAFDFANNMDKRLSSLRVRGFLTMLYLCSRKMLEILASRGLKSKTFGLGFITYPFFA